MGRAAVIVRAVDPARSRIVLVGVPIYRDPKLPDIPQVTNNIVDLAAVWTDPELGGFPPEHCVRVRPDATQAQIGDLLDQAAAEAEDLLLLYFAGHGLVDRRGELYLGLHDARFDNAPFSALRFEAVRDTFLDRTRAENRMVILDCCFSGRAIGGLLSPPGPETLTDRLTISGTYILTATAPNSPALASDAEPNTAFTGRLLRLLHDGVPAAGELLTPRDIYYRLRTLLHADGLPLPEQRGTDTADMLGLVRNRSFIAREAGPETAFSQRTSHGPKPRPIQETDHKASELHRRARAILHQAQHIATGITSKTKQTEALHNLVRPLAMVAPGRARRIAITLTDNWSRQSALAAVAGGLAATDPDRAKRIAATITNDRCRDLTLSELAGIVAADDIGRAESIVAAIGSRDQRAQAWADIAVKLAPIDADQAATLLDRAEHEAETAVHPIWWARTLVAFAEALPDSDPDRADLIKRAERELVNAPHDDAGSWTLFSVVNVMAVIDPDRAEDIADTIVHDHPRVLAYVAIAEASATKDLDSAEHLIAGITDDETRSWALFNVAATLAAKDPDNAERIASTIRIPDIKAQAYAELAARIAATDAARAAALVAETEQQAFAIADEIDGAETRIAAFFQANDRTEVTTETARSVPLSDADLREIAVDGIRSQERALAAIAKALAVIAPDQAESITALITDEGRRVKAMADMAEAWLLVSSASKASTT